jgi:hypothetical protein
MENEPEFFDAKIAGWWVWGLSAWIGDNWCGTTEQNSLPRLSCVAGVHTHTHTPHAKCRISRADKACTGKKAAESLARKHGGGGGGQSRSRRSDTPTGIRRRNAHGGFFDELAERLRYVRVCCGDWSRVCKPSVCEGNGLTGVFLDPPYGDDQRTKVYDHDDFSLSAHVRAWALANAGNPQLRIALCGYEGEHVMPESWECVEWKATGGYANQNAAGNANAHRERIWFSPHCLKDVTLFEGVA